jgi:hypothetical protein
MGTTAASSKLKSHVDGIALPPVVIAVAIQEFESWLLGDHPAVQSITATSFDQPKEPESMAPGEAKGLLSKWLTQAPNLGMEQARRELAQRCDLDRVCRRCPSFATLVKDLRAAFRHTP